ncbi:MFS transporter [Actinoplanes sp. NPDC026670]|uniref:MFS transporter n=1 Tax=Actinoplanes sp. NPDC026670 TaxID=3154700 RepID=UPI00340F3E4A
MPRFIVFSVGLLTSVLGSAFTGLAMGVWVFQHTGSATQYSITLLVSLLPGVIFGPLAGALVDRWNRRVLLIVSEAVSAVPVLVLALLYSAGDLQPWHIFVFVGIQSVIRAIQLPAMSASIVLLAPPEQVARANGVVMLAQALGNTVGFAAGGVLYLLIDLNGVLLVDFATFVFNMAILAIIRIPQPPRSDAGQTGSGGLIDEIRAGWRIVATRRTLVTILLFSAALNVSLGYADAMLTPLVLSFASAAALGIVIACMGVGAIAGSLALATWGGPRRRVIGLAGFAIPLGLFLCLGALRPSIPLIVVAALGFTFCFTIVDGTSRNILQVEVEPDVQGRVFATYNMVGGAVLASSYLLAGPVADRLFEPLLLADGALAGSVGAVIGVGPGRGMALLMLLIGVVMLITAVVASQQDSLRRLPDRPVRKTAEPVSESEPATAPSNRVVS